jgi:hypothetical protein
VRAFAAKERAAEEARHVQWEAEAKGERRRLAKERKASEEEHERKLDAAHAKQLSQATALQTEEAHEEAQLKQLERRRAALLQGGAGGFGDATLTNEGARMTLLFEGKDKVHQLRLQFQGMP